jgi:gliding motility-associated-like protein
MSFLSAEFWSMSGNSKFLNYTLLFLFVLLAAPLHAQLNGFGLEVTPTQETCLGNGALSFSIINGTPGATMLYTVYKQPDLTTPISVSPENFTGSLTAGTYTVLALQTLDLETNSQEQEITIESQVTPLSFSVLATNQNCSDGAQLVINTVSGFPAQYEILSGPVTADLQESNIFSNLPAGTYVIRVFDECGWGEVTTYTLVQNDSPPQISDPIYETQMTGDCDTVNITNTIAYPDGIGISYPVTINYTVTPVNGDTPTVITQTFESGDPVMLTLTQQFPADAAEYTYSIEIIDNCNVSFVQDGMEVNPKPALNYELMPIPPCGEHYLSLDVSQYKPPYMVNFLSAPEGFDPVVYNTSHPGPFTESNLIYGNDNTPMPEGTYEVEITDSCSRTATANIIIADDLPDPVVSGRNNGCFSEFGRMTIAIPDRDIISAIILTAPAAYTQPLPDDVSNFINPNGRLVISDLPVGHYILKIVDECGKEYEVPVEIPPFVEQGFTANGMADCTIGSGAISLSSGNGKMVSLTMTAAPAEFTEEMPYDVSFNISQSGLFSMNGLPQGEYTFHGTDMCGIEGTVTVSVVGNQPPPNAFTFVRHCGSYDVVLADSATQTLIDPPTYWLQKKIGTGNVWGHPQTGAIYTEGTEPTDTNSVSLENNQTLYNLTFEGTFRVMKYFESVGSGVDNKACFGDLGTFDYTDGVTIQNIYNISCMQNADDIYIEATGLGPMNYRIEKKNGETFILDNGTNNIFSGLDPATYEFVVEDACGYVGMNEQNINLLPELTDANDPGDMMICIEEGSPVFAEFDLASQTSGVLGNQSPDVYTVSYHLTAADANTGSNPLPELYTNISNPQIIYARLIHDHIPLCHGVVPFGLQVSERPLLQMATEGTICNESGSTILTADAGYDSYEWSTGANTRSITVFEPGTYTVTVSIVYGDVTCSTTNEVVVTPSGPADILSVETQDWTTNQNSISVSVSGEGSYEYSLDDNAYQDSPVFDNLEPGIYTLYIRDKNGCGTVTTKVVLLNYPKFFTPNGDGINDTWRIPYSWVEPDMEIYLFDRYGKFIISFSPLGEGWDGNYHGRPLPSTDYWFMVIRKDGQVHRGHFSMIR